MPVDTLDSTLILLSGLELGYLDASIIALASILTNILASIVYVRTS